MELVKPKGKPTQSATFKQLSPEISEEDQKRFFRVVSTDLNDEQKQLITSPAQTFTRQKKVLAVHWHPEFVPMDLIAQRIEKLYPNKDEELVIPTQHNHITSYGNYSGVEVDCYSRGFQRKVQLLLHFKNEKVQDAPVLKSLLKYTFRYRSSQLFDFIHTITKPLEDRLNQAALETGSSEEVVHFTQIAIAKIEKLLEEHYDEIPIFSLKNKLLRNFIDTMRTEYGNEFINRVQIFLQAVKKIVKENFSLTYFYRTSEIIEEARALGAGIVIPHPEQFWPILLANYDVDGYEVWNPQSQEYTEFLISVVFRRNMQEGLSKRKLLVFMGDDTHMAEKLKDPSEQNHAKASREIGLQPAWNDLDIRKKLIKGDMLRSQVIKEYRERLA
jgi:hypothetical protein